jgi:hypothetical protein
VEKGAANGVDPTELLTKFDDLDQMSARYFVPRFTVHAYIDVRHFLHDMRDRITEGEPPADA